MFVKIRRKRGNKTLEQTHVNLNEYPVLTMHENKFSICKKPILRCCRMGDQQRKSSNTTNNSKLKRADEFATSNGSFSIGVQWGRVPVFCSINPGPLLEILT